MKTRPEWFDALGKMLRGGFKNCHMDATVKLAGDTIEIEFPNASLSLNVFGTARNPKFQVWSAPVGRQTKEAWEKLKDDQSMKNLTILGKKQNAEGVFFGYLTGLKMIPRNDTSPDIWWATFCYNDKISKFKVPDDHLFQILLKHMPFDGAMDKIFIGRKAGEWITSLP